jgi:hypothetical protein
MTLKLPLFRLGKRKPRQKVAGLSSQSAVRRHRAAQGRTVNRPFYLGATRHVRDAVCRHSQETPVCCVTNHKAPPKLGANCAADIGRKPHSTGASVTKHPSHSSTQVFPALRTPGVVKHLKMRNDPKYRHTATYIDGPSEMPGVLPAAEEPLQ